MVDDKKVDPASIDWAKKDEFRKDFNKRASYAFVFMSFGVGVLALITPIILPLLGGYDGHYSISYFYHVVATHDIFVGLLCATGIFLMLFQGLSKWENWLLTLAGVFLILVALVPTGLDQCNDSAFSWHAAFAVSFFLCLFIVAIFFAKSRLEYILWPPLRRKFEWLYNISGTAMIFLPLAAYVIHLIGGKECSHVIYWVEAGAIIAFALYWFTKTVEYMRLLGVDITDIAAHLRS